MSATTADEKHLDLLRPLGRLTRRFRALAAEFASIDRPENFGRPYHGDSVCFAWREMRRARFELHHAFRRCIEAEIEPWKIRLACHA